MIEKNTINISDYWKGFILILIMAYVPLFDALGSLPIVLWDESRIAINAMEMFDSGNWLYLTYDGVPDHWNAKPPMLIWLQVISIKLFGMTEFAIRFPTAVAALSTCLLLYWFLGKKLKQPLLGVIACAVLLTSEGYVKVHGVRTGDFDGLLTLCMFSYAVFYYLYLEEGKRKYFFITVLAIIVAVLTKGIAGMVMFPALLIYTLYKKQLLVLLKTPSLYVGVVSFLFVILGYYFLRDHFDKNYIVDMLDNEVTGRFWRNDRMANNDHLYYYKFLTTKNFKLWAPFLLVGFSLSLVADGKKWKGLMTFAAIFGLTQFLFVSQSESKTEWYDMPCYPFFSIIAALGVYLVYSYIKKEATVIKSRKSIVSVTFLLLIFIVPVHTIYKSIRTPKAEFLTVDNLNMGYYMKGIVKDKSIYTENINIVHREYCADILWYVKVLKHEGRDMSIVHVDSLREGNNVIIAFEDAVKQQIESTFTFEKEDNFRNVTLYRLYGKK